MDKQGLVQAWDQMRQKYGVYLRILEAIPEDRYHSTPIPGMRSPAQLAAHTSGTIIRDISEGVAKGAITADEAGEDRVVAGFKSKADVLAFARKCWDEADAAVKRTGDAELQALVTTPWNMSFPGWVGYGIQLDEFLHHRGQLSVFVRACGSVPPFIWGFGENAPEFRPTA